MSRVSQIFFGASFIFSLICCACSQGPGSEKFHLDPSIYAKTPDPSAIVEVEMLPGSVLKVPVNLILFAFDEQTDPAAARAAIEDLGGELVGQIPGLHIYQGEFAALTTLAALDAKIDAIIAQNPAGLVSATYDAYPTPFQDLKTRSEGSQEATFALGAAPALEKCTVVDDNMWIEKVWRCPLENPEYYNLSVIMETLVKFIPLRPVRLGLMDTGLQQDYGEFDDTTVINVDDPGQTARDPDPKMHGTKVASIMAADDDGQGINGVASKVLGQALTLGIAQERNAAANIAALAQMSGQGFSVINMSFGMERIVFDGPRYDALRAIYKSGLAKLDQTLFVAAAANRAFELTRTNDFPAGLDLPNLITVGGLTDCGLDDAASHSSYGPLIDIAAAAVDVPCISYKGLPNVAVSDGNSFTAPQVAALAAILESIEPDLSPAEIKDTILDNAMRGAPTMGGRRLVYTTPVLQLLASTSRDEEVLDLIDRYGEDDPGLEREADISGIVVNRICGGIEYTVSTSGGAEWDGTYKIAGDEEENPGSIIADESGSATWLLGTQQDDELPILMISCMSCGFKVFGESYGVEHGVQITFQPDQALSGTAHSGFVRMDNCQITQRYDMGGLPLPGFEDMENAPAMIEVEGVFSGAHTILVEGGIEKNLSVSGTFVTPMAIPLMGDLAPLIAYVEENCLGGLGAP